MLRDDRNESYLGAMKEMVTNRTQIVVTILPSNRKDRYDAIKKYTCIDFPGKLLYLVAKTVSVCYFLRSSLGNAVYLF